MRIRLLLSLVVRSAWNRRFGLLLTVASIALSTFLLLGIERLRLDTRDSFASAVSGTDLVVGARTSPVPLVLSTLFHIGAPQANMQWTSVQALARHPAVEWVAPVSLGDSVDGQTVLGITDSFLAHYRHGDRQPLVAAQGDPSLELFDAVLGAEAARRLSAAPGSALTLRHGDDEGLGADHADKPFTVRAVLKPTGTPVDRSVLVGLSSLEALHLDWQAGVTMPGVSIPAGQVRKFDLQPKQVSGALVGLKSRAAVFLVQRWINSYLDEALTAVLPSTAMDQVWSIVGLFERVLQLMSAVVAFVGLAGLVAVLSTSLDQRRRELAILRAVGASPRHVLVLLLVEGALVTGTGVIVGSAILSFVQAIAAPWLQAAVGLQLMPLNVSLTQFGLALALLAVGTASSLVPAWRAYRLSLADGLSVRV
jgi:putative ABC transport system permease protein